MSIQSLNPKPDPNSEFTQRFLLLLRGDETSLPLSPEFQLQRNTLRGKESREPEIESFRKIEKLEFLHEEAQNGDRTYYYKASLDGEPIYAIVTMTAQQQVANYGSGTPP